MDAKKLILIAAVALFFFGLTETSKNSTAGKSVRPAKDRSVKNALQNLLNAGISIATAAATAGEKEAESS